MFKRLRKKIEEEVGTITGTENERPFPNHGPGVASPVHSDSIGSPMFNFSKKEPWDPDAMSVSSEASDMNVTSKEEVLKMLLKRTEQVKKLESKISDLAFIIKDRNKTIERLELALEKEQQDAEQKFQQFNKQYQTNRAKMADNVQIKMEEMKKEIEDLQEGKEKLATKLQEAQEWKDKFFQGQEDNDEFQGLATQELAKVKHMLLLAQEELSGIRSELAEKVGLLESSQQNETELTNEVDHLLGQLSRYATRSEELEEQNKTLSKESSDLTGLRDGLDSIVKDMENQLLKKSADYSTLEHSYSDLQNEYHTFQHNSELHQNKTDKLLEEKEELVGHLEERIQTLEQRLQDNDLSGDERITALGNERDVLERRLTEAREQLTQVKSSWSEKISQLEAQIANLNRKIAEDSQDMATCRLESETTQANLSKQIQDLLSQLEKAQAATDANLESSLEKDRILEKQKERFETEITRISKNSCAMEEKLKGTIGSLQGDIETLRQTLTSERLTAQQNIAQLQEHKDEWLEKEIDSEKQITMFEEQIQKLKAEIAQRDKYHKDELNRIQDKTRDTEKNNKRALEGELETERTKTTQLHSVLKNFQEDFHVCSKEKDDLLLRNAELFQKLESQKRESQHSQQLLEQEVLQREAAIAGLEQSLQEIQEELSQYKHNIEELESQHKEAIAVAETNEVTSLKNHIQEIEEKLAEKTKLLRKQEQRLNDLQKTLRRELKMQSFTHDDAMDVINSRSGGNLEILVHRPVQTNPNSKTNSQPPSLPVSSSSTRQLDPRHTAPAAKSFSYGRQPNKGPQLVVTDGDWIAQTCDYCDRDINLQYLKHVILKFVLSRETEAVQLVKAVAMLLKFSPDEQKLMRETLEYKMSWFGTRPALGKGQLAKVIAP